jgi:hypothetical protein
MIVTALLVAAGITTSTAQAVYSVNIVGYINKSLPHGLTLIANQLNASPDNKVQTIFGTPPNSLTVSKFNPTAGNFDQAAFDTEGGWSDLTSMVLNPGEGAFVDNSGDPYTLTLVGEVKLSSTVNIHPGLDTYSSVIPQSGPISSLGFPTPTAIISVFKFVNGAFVTLAFDPEQGWSPSEPSLDIAEGIFVDNSGASLAWTRNFTVGP